MHSVRQIEVVKALAKHRHFGRAAKALGVTQPALTRSSEADRGRTRGQAVRPAGRDADAFWGDRTRARRSCGRRDSMISPANWPSPRAWRPARSSLAVAPYPADNTDVRAIANLSERRPNMHIELRPTKWTRVDEDVRQGPADVGLTDVYEAEHNSELHVETLQTTPGRLLLPRSAPDHPQGPTPATGVNRLSVRRNYPPGETYRRSTKGAEHPRRARQSGKIAAARASSSRPSTQRNAKCWKAPRLAPPYRAKSSGS